MIQKSHYCYKKRFMLLSTSRWRHLRPRHGGPCSESGRLFLLQHREGLPLHWRWWIRTKVQPDQVWIWLPGGLPLTAVQIQDSCEFIPLSSMTTTLVLISFVSYGPLNPVMWSIHNVSHNFEKQKNTNIWFYVNKIDNDNNNNTYFILFPKCHSSHQDKAQPETQASVFGDVAFNALLALDDPSAMSLVRQPGSDGFRLDSTALFQVGTTMLFLNRQWRYNSNEIKTEKCQLFMQTSYG